MKITAYEYVAMLGLAAVMGLGIVTYRSSTTAINITNDSNNYLRGVTISNGEQVLWESDIAPQDSFTINTKWPGGNKLYIKATISERVGQGWEFENVLGDVKKYTLDTQVIRIKDDEKGDNKVNHYSKPWL